MIRPSRVLLCVVVLAAAACSPSIDKAAKADVDRQLSEIQNSGEVYPPTDAAAPMPLAVGQWTRYKTVDDEGKPGLLEYRVVGQDDAGAWILEVDTDSYYGNQQFRYHMVVDETRYGDPGAIDITALSMKDKDGNVTDYPAEMLSVMGGAMDDALENLVSISWTELPREDASAPAGTFQQSYKGRSKVSALGNTYTSDVWWHPVVPLGGMVRSVGQDNGNAMELVAFGTTGAQSEF